MATFEEFQVAITVRPVASSEVRRSFFGITVQPESGTTSRTYRGPAGEIESFFAEELAREARGDAIYLWQDHSTAAVGIGLKLWTEPRASPFERYPTPLMKIRRVTLMAHLKQRWAVVKPPPPLPPVEPVDPAQVDAMRPKAAAPAAEQAADSASTDEDSRDASPAPARSGGRPKGKRNPRVISLVHSWRADICVYGEVDDNVTRAKRIETRWREKKKRPRDGLIAYDLDDKDRGSENRGRLKPGFREELDRLQARHPRPILRKPP